VIYPVAVLITAPGHIIQPGVPHPETAPSDRLRYVHTDVGASYGWRKLSDVCTRIASRCVRGLPLAKFMRYLASASLETAGSAARARERERERERGGVENRGGWTLFVLPAADRRTVDDSRTLAGKIDKIFSN